ncbi:MAG TPA: dicarboxylate/amino acid:cation symporter [Candidatus Xenobia bacterium]|jgi:Na+/H+-dicarboxylate symporter
MTRTIFLSVVAGVALGVLLNAVLTADQAAALMPYLHLVPLLFLRLIKCIVAPLVLTMLTVGIADHGDSKAVGRMGAKAMILFVLWSLTALTIGLTCADVMQPGVNSHLVAPTSASTMQVEPFSIMRLMEEIVPESVAGAWANNAVLQIVLVGILTGLALSACQSHAAAASRRAREELAQAGDESARAKAQRAWRHARHEVAAARLFLHGMKAGKLVTFQVVSFVMMLAPAAAFFSLAAVLTASGPGVLITYGRFALEFLVALAILWFFFYTVATVVAGRRVPELLRMVREPALLAFSTASSESALPKLLEGLDGYGVPSEISGLVLPLGYSFNLDGSMIYCSFAVLFIAQVYGLQVTLPQQIVMLLTLMVTSKGMAAVPKAALVVITSTLTQFHIPEAGLALILAVDQLLDMCRTATNVLGNALTCVIVAVWEGAMKSAPAVITLPPLPEPEVERMVQPT